MALLDELIDGKMDFALAPSSAEDDLMILWKNGRPFGIKTANLSAGRAEGVAFNAIGTMDNGDRIELWVENDTAARNVTALQNGYVILSERPS